MITSNEEMTDHSSSLKNDYSESATLIPFDHPLPLLRVPVRAGPTDNPSAGPFLLAFKNPQAFFSAYNFCQSKIREQCESGVRIGCALKASDNCKPPWWRVIFGGHNRIDFKERESCEEREMAICLEASKDKCREFTKERCLGPFKSARVACRRRSLDNKELGRLISCISCLGALKENVVLETILLRQLGSLLCSNFFHEVTCNRGSELLSDSDS